VEVEAMHGAAITALAIYDMLKPIDKEIEISTIRLSEKKGGKSDFKKETKRELKSAVIVCSDAVARGESKDQTGKAIIDKLKQYHVETSLYEIIPDEANKIKEKVLALSQEKYDLVIFSGGTGLSPRDITPETIAPLLDRHIPGIMEAARHYGQERTPYAMLSRGVAGFIKSTLVITVPGSVRGAEETIRAIFPQLLHVFQVAEGMRHS
jgi:molybdenum cofactor synthesis domain-containing protein